MRKLQANNTIPRWLMGLLAPFMVATVTSRLPLANTRARQELDWQPQFPSYREGLQQVANELQAQGEIISAAGQISR